MTEIGQTNDHANVICESQKMVLVPDCSARSRLTAITTARGLPNGFCSILEYYHDLTIVP
jgi:hypothetical protein